MIFILEIQIGFLRFSSPMGKLKLMSYYTIYLDMVAIGVGFHLGTQSF